MNWIAAKLFQVLSYVNLFVQSTSSLFHVTLFSSALPNFLYFCKLDYVYIKDMKFSKNISFPTIASIGCNCQGTCTDPRSCACAKLNGGDFPYVHRDGGR